MMHFQKYFGNYADFWVMALTAAAAMPVKCRNMKARNANMSTGKPVVVAGAPKLLARPLPSDLAAPQDR
jgi:hypothetical protein